MIRHYLTFAHQAEALDEALAGRILAECWSQEKYRLQLRFIEGTDSLFVELFVDLHLGYALTRRDLNRARKNTIDFFDELLGAKLAHVTMHEGERVIIFSFTDGRELQVFFFGKGSGNVLLTAGGEVKGSLMAYGGEYDPFLGEAEEESHRDRAGILASFRSVDGPAVKALARAVPELGRRLATEALYRAGLDESTPGPSLSDEEVDTLLRLVDLLYADCLTTRTYRVYILPEETIFALTEMRHLDDLAERVETFDRIGPAVQAYRSLMFRGRRVGELRAWMLKRLVAEISRLDRADAKRRADAEHTARADEWELNGSILLSHIADVPKGISEVVLPDWEGTGRVIALNPRMTPIENAERYFKRARGAREASVQAQERTRKGEQERQEAARLREEVERAERVEELERIEARYPRIFRMMGEAREEGTAERFRRFEVAGGHEVFAGKTAANNDELTVRFARPNDYWFHARGSSGSHVILRWNDPKTKPPREALRAAASIAAYYSGAKNAKTAPVAYTLKKYVRKPKGAKPGSVVMEREEVIMVEPKLPEGTGTKE